MPDKPNTQLNFTEFIDRIDKGTLSNELEEELQNVVAAVQESGKTGKLKLEIKVKPAAQNDSKQLFIEPKIKTNEPRPSRAPSIFYADEESRLHRSDPDQIEMDMRPTPEEKSVPLRKVEG